MARRCTIALSIMIGAFTLAACSQVPTSLGEATLSITKSCGVGMFDHNVRIWVKGTDAQKACASIIAAVRQEGSQPIAWDGSIAESGENYSPVCSDVLHSLSYEVVDTGGHDYGRQWCQWMVQAYGASGSATEPDLLGIISTAQQAEMNANAVLQATQQEHDRIYAQACSQHNGYVSSNGNCIANYPGWPSQPVTINPDGTWDTFQADINSGNCEIAVQDAAAAMQEGWPWTIQPQYHQDTGVCVPGAP